MGKAAEGGERAFTVLQQSTYNIKILRTATYYPLKLLLLYHFVCASGGGCLRVLSRAAGAALAQRLRNAAGISSAPAASPAMDG